MPLFFFELSGEHDTMCAAEAVRCIETETDSFCIVAQGPGYIIGSFDDKFSIPIANRISLTRCFGHYLGSFDVNNLLNVDSIKIPEGSFAIRVKRFKGMMKSIDSQVIIKKLGDILSKKNDVDLERPDHEVHILISDRLHIFLNNNMINRNIFETRKIGKRPFFSPISIHPKYARALINLTGVKKGDTILDPFCGTGGIVIEAGLMGVKVIASDFDPKMIAGTLENMNHYGLNMYDYDVLDVSDITKRFDDVDAVVTDPPYGRSTSTGGESIESIYKRAMMSFNDILKPGGYAGVIFPNPIDDSRLILQQMFIQKVHGSLSRHYHIFEKRA
ncbi:MAG: THUMP domain-containing protein [archaeon]|nr:THUMP domain-containing protein [archaeon]